MKRVLMLGAGYAGLPAVKRIARQVRSDQVEVTLVNGTEDFVERPRLHQIAVGQDVRVVPLKRYLDGSGVRFVQGWVTEIDLAGRSVTATASGRVLTLPFDILVYALGSNIDIGSVPGVRENTVALTDIDASVAVPHKLRALRDGAAIVVCGSGLTGIEIATEVAESYPSFSVRLVGHRPPGHWLSDRARNHLNQVLDTLNIQVTSGVRVSDAQPLAFHMNDGSEVPFDLAFWAGGFRVPSLARDAGLAVTGEGRARVNDRLLSISHPDVYVIGDAAAVCGSWGTQFAMGCRTGGFTGPKVADVVTARLTGREVEPLGFRYIHECISLGRRHGVVQFLDADGSPKQRILTGRMAIAYKNAVLDGGRVAFKRPGPAFPRRRSLADQ